MRKHKRSICLLLTGALLISLVIPTRQIKAAGENEKNLYWPKGESVESASAIVIEAETGTILYGKNIHKKHYPASITKIMTTLLALENCNLDETVTFSHDSVYKIEGTHIARDVGEKMSLEDTLYGVMLASANECAYATAEHVTGDYDKFVQLMNKKAKELGCQDTHFNNPHGLPDENHYTSAYDMSLIARAAINNETFRNICGTKTYTIPPTNKHKDSTYLINHHGMLTSYKTSRYLYDYCIGGKTGYTVAAKNTLVTFAQKKGMTLICVVMKADTPNHYTDTRSLLDYCFDNFQLYHVSKHEKTYSEDALKRMVSFEGNEPLFSLDTEGVIVLPKGSEFSQAKPEINYDKADLNQNIAGTLDYYYGSHYVGGTNILVSSKEDQTYHFGNSEIKQTEKTAPKKRVIQIKRQWIFGILVLVLGLGLSILLGVYLTRNQARLRYLHRQKKEEKRYRSSLKNKRRRRRR